MRKNDKSVKVFFTYSDFLFVQLCRWFELEAQIDSCYVHNADNSARPKKVMAAQDG